MAEAPKKNTLAARLAGIELAIAHLARLNATATKTSPTQIAQSYRAIAKGLPADAPGRAEIAAVMQRIARAIQPRKPAVAPRSRKGMH